MGFGKVAPPRQSGVWLPERPGRRESRARFIERRREKRSGRAAGAAPALLQRENKTRPPAKQRCLGSETHFPVRLEPGFYLISLSFYFFLNCPTNPVNIWKIGSYSHSLVIPPKLSCQNAALFCAVIFSFFSFFCLCRVVLFCFFFSLLLFVLVF